jgi:hypothetical protein
MRSTLPRGPVRGLSFSFIVVLTEHEVSSENDKMTG